MTRLRNRQESRDPCASYLDSKAVTRRLDVSDHAQLDWMAPAYMRGVDIT